MTPRCRRREIKEKIILGQPQPSAFSLLISSSFSSAVNEFFNLLGPGLLVEPFLLEPLSFFFFVGLGLPSSSLSCGRFGAEDVGLLAPLLPLSVGVLLRVLLRPEMFIQRSKCCATLFMTKYRGQIGHLLVGISGIVLSF